MNEYLQEIYKRCMEELKEEKDPLRREYIMGVLCGITMAEFAYNERVHIDNAEK